jgi:hypothetical protein
MNLSYPTIKGRWFVCCFGTVRSPKWWQVVVYHTQIVHYNLCSMTHATLLLMNHNRHHKIIALFLYNYNTKFVENEQACNKSCNLTFPCPFAIWFLLFRKLKYYIAQKQQIPSFYHGPMHYQRWKIIKIIMFHLCFAPNNMFKKATYLNMPKVVSCLEITSWK